MSHVDSFIRWFAGQGRRLLLGGRWHFTDLWYLESCRSLIFDIWYLMGRNLISAQMVLLAALVDHCSYRCLFHERHDKGCIIIWEMPSFHWLRCTGKTHSSWDSQCRKTRDRLGGTSHSDWVETLFSDITCEVCRHPDCQCQHLFNRHHRHCHRRLSWFQHQRPQQQ